MPMFVCLSKDKWVPARCIACPGECGLSHPVTQEIGTQLYGAGFDTRKPAAGGDLKPLAPLGSEPTQNNEQR